MSFDRQHDKRDPLFSWPTNGQYSGLPPGQMHSMMQTVLALANYRVS